MKKKLLALLLALTTILTMMPAMALTALADTTPAERPLQYDDYVTELDGVTATAETVVLENSLIEKVQVGDTYYFHAKEVGSGKVTIAGTEHDVSVEKADISLVLLSGQSNAEIRGTASKSILCPLGTAYFGAHMDDTTFTMKGSAGIAGLTSGIAYGWHQATGEKVWIVNFANGGSKISQWQSATDGNLKSALDAINGAYSFINDEGNQFNNHYRLIHKVYLWMQGESDRGIKTEDYITQFLNTHNILLTNGGLDQGGIISTRNFTSDVFNVDDTSNLLDMDGSRLAHFVMTNSKDEKFKKIHMASNVGDYFYNDASTKSYFEKYDSELPYQTRDNVKALPTKVREVMNTDAKHYLQPGYNEIGFDAGNNFGELCTEKHEATSITLLKRDGKNTILNEAVEVNDLGTTVVPITSPIYAKIDTSVSSGFKYVNGLFVKDDELTDKGKAVFSSDNVSREFNLSNKAVIGEEGVYHWNLEHATGNVGDVVASDNGIDLIITKGSITDGVANGLTMKTSQTIVLNHQNKWTGSIDTQYKTNGYNIFLFSENDGTTGSYFWICDGKRASTPRNQAMIVEPTSGTTTQIGADLPDGTIDSNVRKTYEFYNEIVGDQDGVKAKIGEVDVLLNACYTGGTKTEGTPTIGGVDYKVNYIGAEGPNHMTLDGKVYSVDIDRGDDTKIEGTEYHWNIEGENGNVGDIVATDNGVSLKIVRGSINNGVANDLIMQLVDKDTKQPIKITLNHNNSWKAWVDMKPDFTLTNHHTMLFAECNPYESGQYFWLINGSFYDPQKEEAMIVEPTKGSSTQVGAVIQTGTMTNTRKTYEYINKIESGSNNIYAKVGDGDEIILNQKFNGGNKGTGTSSTSGVDYRIGYLGSVITQTNVSSYNGTIYSINIEEGKEMTIPKSSLSSGEYVGPQTIKLTCSTSGADIYYTTDGTTPSKTHGTKYTAPITVDTTVNLKAVAVKGDKSSKVISLNYTIKGNVTLQGNGGSGTDLTEYTCGTKADLPTDWEKTGYEFAGWYDNDECIGAAVTEIPATAKGDKEYWAKWKAIPAVAPTIDVQPKDTDMVKGDKDKKLSVKASTDENHDLSYQWFKNDKKSTTEATELTGETDSTLNFDPKAEAGDSYYFCVVTATRKGSGTTETKTTDVVKVSVSKVKMIEGEKQTIKVESKAEVKFRSNAAFNTFKHEVLVDKNELTEGVDYEVAEGSTVVTLKPEFVSSLKVGVHGVEIVSDGGIATGELKVVPEDQPVKPDDDTKTGDDNNIIFYGLTAILALLGAGSVYGFRRREHR